MCSRALAFVLAIVMAWMGLTAQQQAATVFSESLVEPPVAQADGMSSVASMSSMSSVLTVGSLDAHHLDDLPFQLLADLIGLLGPGESPTAPGVPVRPAAPWPVGWPAPDLDHPHRPPIVRA